jgi:DNA-binding NarL/FixJ family response regulator
MAMIAAGRPWRLIVVDNHDVARIGLVAILSTVPELSIVAQARDAAGARAATREHAPDLVLLDMLLPDAEALDVARQIRAESPAVRVVMMSSSDLPERVVEAFEAGASGYILKSAPQHEIVDEVLRALRGEPLLIPPSLLRTTGVSSGDAQADARRRVERLTPRQRDVLALLASGLSSRVIAERLGIQPSTVRKITEQVFRQLGVTNRTQAAIYWLLAVH